MNLPLTKADINAKQESLRQVRDEYSNNLASILSRLDISLFFSTYQAGIGAIAVKHNSLKIGFHNFERAMGMAISPTQMI